MFAAASLASSLASGLFGSSLVFALATEPRSAPVDSGAPSAIEQALIEHACTGTQSIGANGEDANAQCLDARLLALRSEFGRDLSRLSPSERRKLDSACSRFQTTRGREAYLDCLHAELASLSARRNRGNVPGAAETVGAAAPADQSSDTISSLLRPPATPSSSLSPLLLVTAVLIVAAGAAAGVLFTVKARRVRQTCRVCRVQVPGAGDLCPSCRHDAAEALRRAAAERDERQRGHEEEERRQRDEAEEQRQQKERADEEARARLEEARRRDEARQREEATLQQEEDARRRQLEAFRREPSSLCDEGEPTFDPYAVLGLSPDATDEQVRAAFEEARTKYDPDQVAHLGDDVQAHFAARSRAAERAYQMLAGEVDAPAAAAGRG